MNSSRKVDRLRNTLRIQNKYSEMIIVLGKIKWWNIFLETNYLHNGELFHFHELALCLGKKLNPSGTGPSNISLNEKKIIRKGRKKEIIERRTLIPYFNPIVAIWTSE